MDLNVWDKCNNFCLMCTNPSAPWPAVDGSFDYSYEAIISRLEKYRKKFEEGDCIYLTGGEPTLHPNFLEIFSYLTENFPNQRLILLTNGRRFFYKDFVKKLFSINSNFQVDMSLLGDKAKVHDSIARARGSFYQAKEGLKNLLFFRDNQFINVRFIITAFNYKHIPQFLKMIKKEFLGLDRLILIFWEIENHAETNFKSLKVRYPQVKDYLEKSIGLIEEINKVGLYHFSLCNLPPRLWPYMWRTLDSDDVEFIDICNKCKYKKYCLGIQKCYLNFIGKEDFSPIKEDFKIDFSGNFYRPIDKIEIK